MEENENGSFFANQNRVLVVDDLAHIREELSDLLYSINVKEVVEASTLKEAVSAVQQGGIDSIISDLLYPVGEFSGANELTNTFTGEMYDAIFRIVEKGGIYTEQGAKKILNYVCSLKNGEFEPEDIPSGTLLTFYAAKRDIPIVINTDLGHHNIKVEPIAYGGAFYLTNVNSGKNAENIINIDEVKLNRRELYNNQFPSTKRLAELDSTYE
ncbi:MAG: response regulator transcription factor [Candidatus Woesearchaeota archaeon]